MPSLTNWKLGTLVNVDPFMTKQEDPQIVALSDGGYAVVFVDHIGDNLKLVGQRYSALGEKVGSGIELSNFLVQSSSSPSVTVMPDGGITVAFISNGDIVARRFDANLNFIRQDVIDNGATETVDPVITPFADGSYMVAYTLGEQNVTPGDTDIVGRRVSSTGVVGAQFTIFNDTDDSDLAELATLSNGNVIAVWQSEFQGSSSDLDIQGRIITPDGGQVLGPFGIPGATGTESETAPDVAALAGGGFVVVWVDATQIRATVLTNTGSVVRADFKVNTSFFGIDPTVVALDDGGFVVSWVNGEVFAQRFDAAGQPVGLQLEVPQNGLFNNETEAAVLRDGRIAYVNDRSLGMGNEVDVYTAIWDVRNNPPIDFDRDVNGDILWRNDDGSVLGWRMQNARHTGFFDLGVIPTQWHIRDTGDFNGDGTTDILWRHDDGWTIGWLMQNGQRSADVDLGHISNQWHIQATGDFDGDGDSDILWRHDDGWTFAWLMNNGQRSVDVDLSHIPSTWHVQGTGDFDGDGDSDILWRHDDGTTLWWQMQNGQHVAIVNLGIVPGQWHIQTTGDFNGDGRSDILWRHNDGTTFAWLMRSGGRDFDGSNFGIIPVQWHIQGANDLNGDGTSDILWRHDNGSTFAWLTNNKGQRSADVDLSVISTAWTIQHPQFDVV
jgi:hypothetical protein